MHFALGTHLYYRDFTWSENKWQSTYCGQIFLTSTRRERSCAVPLLVWCSSAVLSPSSLRFRNIPSMNLLISEQPFRFRTGSIVAARVTSHRSSAILLGTLSPYIAIVLIPYNGVFEIFDGITDPEFAEYAIFCPLGVMRVCSHFVSPFTS